MPDLSIKSLNLNVTNYGIRESSKRIVLTATNYFRNDIDNSDGEESSVTKITREVTINQRNLFTLDRAEPQVSFSNMETNAFHSSDPNKKDKISFELTGYYDRVVDYDHVLVDELGTEM